MEESSICHGRSGDARKLAPVICDFGSAVVDDIYTNIHRAPEVIRKEPGRVAIWHVICMVIQLIRR